MKNTEYGMQNDSDVWCACMVLFLVCCGSLLFSLLIAWVVRMFLVSPIHVLGEWVMFHHTENPGIAFGIHLPSPWQEILIACALIVVMIIAVRASTMFSRIAYGLIMGGALANVVDRLGDGRVTDYIAIGAFPVFNVPDSCITIGVVLLLVESMKIGQNIHKK